MGVALGDGDIAVARQLLGQLHLSSRQKHRGDEIMARGVGVIVPTASPPWVSLTRWLIIFWPVRVVDRMTYYCFMISLIKWCRGQLNNL